MITFITFIIAFMFFQEINGSEPFERNLSIVIPERSLSTGTSASEDDTESLCDIAISSFCAHQTGSPHRLKPYIKQLLEEEGSTPREHRTLLILKRIKSGDNFTEVCETLRIKELLFNAANKALDQKERDIIERELKLEEAKKQLQSKISKKITAALTVTTSAVTTAAAAIITYFAKS